MSASPNGDAKWGRLLNALLDFGSCNAPVVVAVHNVAPADFELLPGVAVTCKGSDGNTAVWKDVRSGDGQVLVTFFMAAEAGGQ